MSYRKRGIVEKVMATVTTPVSVTCSGYVRKPNDVADRRNRHRDRNHFTFILLYAICSLLFATVVDARVKGKCKDCHSMHYSYEGKEMTYGDRPGPFPVLTQGGCLGCHGQNPAGAENIITIGKARIPQVLHHMENGDLAAGNFYYVADGYNPDYSKGHNVSGISLQESPPMNTPPSFIGSVIIPGGIGPVEWPGQQQLTCAGTWGCHGDRTVEDPYKAIYGAHHADDSLIDGSTVGRSYRFLYGIKGKEHRDWEYQATVSSHNGYKGSIAHDTMDTISYLCGECHARFHPHPNLGGTVEVGYSTLWLRHPSEIAFSTVHGGYAGSEYQDYIRYSLEAPVAYINPTGGEEVVDENSIIMCLSCHRTHASPYPNILRWDYEKTSIGDITKEGCLTCHTRKGQ
ncbi:MAG: cytochrome c3 family protein [Nitrospirota bacterium]